MLAYLLVIYSTFLTRSGALANASVHSFGHPGSLAYTVLLVWLIAFTLGGFGMMILRWKEMKTRASKIKWLTRETLLTIAVIVMGVSAVVILLGTNKPLFSDTAFEPSFYVSINLPLAALMTLLLGLSLHAKWKQENRKLFFKQLLVSGIPSIIVFAVLITLGLPDIPIALLMLTSVFALFVSVDYGYQVVGERPLSIGGALSHAGLALLFLGIIASGKYDQKQSVSLPIHQSESVFGYSLTYAGSVPISPKKDKYVIEVDYNNSSTVLEPEMIKSPHGDNAMWSPDYFSTWKGDLYIEPVSVEDVSGTEGQPIETLNADVSIKPFMNLVWIAAGLILSGLAVAIIRRSKQKD
jgi:cytochrome c-type biogenesis protein CcmF